MEHLVNLALSLFVANSNLLWVPVAFLFGSTLFLFLARLMRGDF